MSLWGHISGSFWGSQAIRPFKFRAIVFAQSLPWGGQGTVTDWPIKCQSTPSSTLTFKPIEKHPELSYFPSSPDPFHVPSATPSLSWPYLCFSLSAGAFSPGPSNLHCVSLVSSFQPEVVSSQNLHSTYLPDLHQLTFYYIPLFWFLYILLFSSHLEFGQLCSSMSCGKKSEFSIKTCFIDKVKWLQRRMGKWTN